MLWRPQQSSLFLFLFPRWGEGCRIRRPATRREMVPDTVTFHREWNHFRSDERIFRCVSSKIRLYIATNEQWRNGRDQATLWCRSWIPPRDIRQIVEGHAVIRHELQSQREEIRDEFNQTRALLRSSFGKLDQRVDTLESDISSLKSRIDKLESWRAWPFSAKIRHAPRNGS